MGMIPEKWSVNGLATELGRDRRTIASRLGALTPAGEGPHGAMYLMADVVRALYPRSNTSAAEDARFEDGYDCGAAALVELLLGECGEEDDPFLTEVLATRLAKSRSPEVCVRILHVWIAKAAWQALLASARSGDVPDPPDWEKLRPEQLSHALVAMVWNGADCDEVLELVARGE